MKASHFLHLTLHTWCVKCVERTAAALQAAQKEVIFHAYPGEPHEFAAAWPTVMQRTTEFFNAALKS